MNPLLVNLVMFSFGFAFLAPRYAERITFRLAVHWAVGGAILLLLAGIFGLAFGKSLNETFLVLDRSNDIRIGVIFGVCALYISFLCCLWSLSLYLQKRKAGK